MSKNPITRAEIAERVNLLGVEPFLQLAAIDALFQRDAPGFMITANNLLGLERVFFNCGLLKDLGIFEAALLDAYQGTRTNNFNFPDRDLKRLFAFADRERLRACGDPIPHAGPFTRYRGVAGKGAARRIRGISWTGKVETARWFAHRLGLADPAIYQATVPIDCVLAYINDRQEDEYLVALAPSIKLHRSRIISEARTLPGSI